MKTKISPKNLTAQLSHRARGNPPGTTLASSVGNYYPGLELDLRNLWRRLFVGIVLHEALALVVDVEEDAPPEVQALLQEILISVDGQPVWVDITGPQTPGGPVEVLDQWSLEWSNALAHAVQKAGSRVRCVFSKGEEGETQELDLEVRPVFEAGPAGPPQDKLGMLSRELAQAGELTQSLCSPWQNDFIGCGCYYWSASRPDYVNVEPDGAGGSRGHNWLQKDRTSATPLEYTLKSSALLQHEDIIESWERKLKFVFKGKDET